MNYNKVRLSEIKDKIDKELKSIDYNLSLFTKSIDILKDNNTISNDYHNFISIYARLVIYNRYVLILNKKLSELEKELLHKDMLIMEVSNKIFSLDMIKKKK